MYIVYTIFLCAAVLTVNKDDYNIVMHVLKMASKEYAVTLFNTNNQAREDQFSCKPPAVDLSKPVKISNIFCLIVYVD